VITQPKVENRIIKRELNKIMLEKSYKEFIEDIPTVVVVKALSIFA